MCVRSSATVRPSRNVPALSRSHDLHATKYPNTAMSAEMVANSERADVAAIASRSCAALYGLEVLEPNIQDSDNNYTRFVVISREPRVYPGANRTSLMITTANEPGALYRVLERFYALNINLIKLESRPIPGRDFEFMFYFRSGLPLWQQGPRRPARFDRRRM